MSFIYYAGHEAEWSKEAVDSMEELTQGQVLQAQVCGYAEDSMPLVYLYAIHGSQVRVHEKKTCSVVSIIVTVDKCTLQSKRRKYLILFIVLEL